MQSQITNLSRIKEPRIDSPWKCQILKARWVSSLFPSSWVLRCFFFYGEKFFWKFPVLGNLPCAQEPRWLRVACWTRIFYVWSSNRLLPSSKKNFQNEAKCKTFVVKVSFICFILKVIFISMASHLALKQRLEQLGNSLLDNSKHRSRPISRLSECRKINVLSYNINYPDPLSACSRTNW